MQSKSVNSSLFNQSEKELLQTESNDAQTAIGLKTNNLLQKEVSFKKQRTVLEKKLYSFNNNTQSAGEE